mgnify:CR=1 FL=1
MSSVDELQKVIDDSHRIVFFGGAGVSTAVSYTHLTLPTIA